MNVLSFVTGQLLYIAPMLLLSLAGIVISLTYLKRFATPAALTLASCALLFVITLGFPFIQGYIFESLNDAGRGGQRHQLMLLAGVANTLLGATAFGLLLAAVFSGRSGSPVIGVQSGPHNSPASIHEPSQQPHRAALVLVLGILSLTLCAPLGIAAWIMGGNDLSAMRSGRMDSSDESLTRVGRILGIIGTVLFGLGVVATCVWFAT